MSDSTPGRDPHNGEPDLNALAAWVDGRLEPGERADLAAHLATCPRCRAIVAELARAAAPPARAWRPVFALAASIAVVAVAGGAYLLVHEREQPAVVPPVIIRPAPPTASPSAPSVAPPTPSSPSNPSPPADRKRAAGTTSVHGKTFRLVAGEWIDQSYRESDFLPAVQVSSRQQLDTIPALRPYAALGSRFTVVIGGTVYRISIP